jgi:hypothetical protein
VWALPARFKAHDSHIKIGSAVFLCNYMSYDSFFCSIGFNCFWFLIQVMNVFHV